MPVFDISLLIWISGRFIWQCQVITRVPCLIMWTPAEPEQREGARNGASFGKEGGVLGCERRWKWQCINRKKAGGPKQNTQTQTNHLHLFTCTVSQGGACVRAELCCVKQVRFGFKFSSSAFCSGAGPYCEGSKQKVRPCRLQTDALKCMLTPFKSIGLSHGLSHLIRYSRCGIGGRAGCQLIPGLEGRSLAPPRALGNRAKLNLCKPFAICTRQGNESVKTYWKYVFLKRERIKWEFWNILIAFRFKNL